MKKLLIILSVVILSLEAPLMAGDNGGGTYEGEEQMLQSLPQSNADWGAWVCYSRYVGPFGWGSYYGWAYNAMQARNNAIYYCSLQHVDYQYCVITGCHVQ